MKKVLLFVMAAMFACTMNAQVFFSDDFESGLDNWTLYDNDGDGYQWMIYSADGTAHGGTQSAMSASYYTDALTPDNWMVSPAITLPTDATGTSLSWYVAAQDADYADEQYAVYISTGNTVSDFTATTAVVDEIIGTAEWTLRTVDLSSYGGQTVYVAFRHYNCTDMFYLKIDDVDVSKPLTTPEIKLSALNIPAAVSVGENFNVSGTIKNLSSVALTSYSVTYNINGGADVATYSVSGINVAYGETHSFTHNLPASLTTAGTSTITVTVSNPNGVADNTADNALSATLTGCGSITQFPFTEHFDNGFGCWSTVDNDGDGNNWMMFTDLYSAMPNYIYNGTGNSALSISYDETSYESLTPDNWLISPAIQLPASGDFKASWYDINISGSYPDSYSVYVATANDIATLSASAELMNETPDATFTQKELSLNDYLGQTVYIAFRHWNSDDNFGLVLDEFTIAEIPSTPEIALSSVNIDPSTVSVGEQFNVGGVVTNNSSAPLNSFKVQYSVDGAASEAITINTPSVAYGETYEFTHTTPATANVVGNLTVTVTVSEPNGTADNTADNSLDASINVCGTITTLPYSEGFESGLGCWTAVSNNTENDETSSNPMGVATGSAVLTAGAHGGNNCFIFSSYSSADDYSQFLISPELNLSSEFQFSFYYTARSTTYPESCQVMYSTTTNDQSSFTAIGDAIEATVTTWQQATVTLPANTKYVAIKYTVTDAMWFLGIDDISLNIGGAEPEQFTVTVAANDNAMGTVAINGNGTTATVTAGSTVTVSATPTTGYHFVSWSDGGSQTHSVTVNSNMTITATFAQDGGSQGIDDVTANSVKLYPNPTTGNLFIEVEGLQKVEVIDAVGRVVMTENAGNSINMSSLANGIYTVRVHANGFTAVKKVVKK